MEALVLAIFGLVYLGMIVGGFPGLALDRTGVALLGAIGVLAAGRLTPEEAWAAIDAPTLSLLFGLMIVSAQLRLGGFYSRLTRAAASLGDSPGRLLAAITVTAGLFSALLANDIVCLAMAPILVEACAERDLDPRPFLLALACAANVGSAATLIGNPQNMLIGQVLSLSFANYLLLAGPPSALGLALVWLVISRVYHGRWTRKSPAPELMTPRFDRWQAGKGVAAIALLVILFLAGAWRRDVLALLAAGCLLLSRRMASKRMLALVDWQLLVLFTGLFVVNGAVAKDGLLDRLLAGLAATGVDLSLPVPLFIVTTLLSNLVSNVPAVMLLLPAAGGSTDPGHAGAVLALASTLAGNLFVVGSIANIIVIEQAANLGIHLSWREHARIGVPVTLLTAATAGAWLWLA